VKPPWRLPSALAAPRESWGELLDAMLHAVWLVDANELVIVAANAAALDLWGGDPADLLGRSVLDFGVTPEDEAFWREAGPASGGGIESEARVRVADGSTAAVMRRVRRVRAATGAAPLYVVALDDRRDAVRREQALEVRAAELAGTLDSLDDGVLVVDLRGAIRHFNRRFADLWELPEEREARGDDDAVLDWMRQQVAEPAAYMRRLAAIEDAPLMRARDLVRLHSGRVLERTAVPQFGRGRPIGRVYTYRETEAPVRGSRGMRAMH
jgi:PAS domain S-box-containing protein